jgi:hypothetical protein
MRISPEERAALSHIADRWWDGPGEGDSVVVTLRFRKPDNRERDDVANLFHTFMEYLDGGYGYRIGVVEDEEGL